MYQCTLERIDTQQAEEALLAKLVLTWLTHALEPLSINDLRYAVSVPPGGVAFDEDEVVEGESLLSVCCGLVILDEETRIVRLIRE